jgi:RNA polymerase-binding transcription factor DksA
MVETENIKNLQKERDRIVDELSRLAQLDNTINNRREGSPFGKREEEADEVMEREKRLIMEKHLNERLADINHALDKFKAGKYGICDNCGKPIQPARLQALPEANLCLDCKSKLAKENRGRPAR